MAQAEALTNQTSTGEYWAPVIKGVVKIVQAFLFIWASLGQIMLKLAGLLARAGSAVIVYVVRDDPELPWEQKYPPPANAEEVLDATDKLEAVVDLLDLVFVRVIPLCRETSQLMFIYYTAPQRIRALYSDESP